MRVRVRVRVRVGARVRVRSDETTSFLSEASSVGVDSSVAISCMYSESSPPNGHTRKTQIDGSASLLSKVAYSASATSDARRSANLSIGTRSR